MKNAGWDINRLPGTESDAFLAQAHFTGAFDDKVDLFLLLIMPGHLSSIRFERNVAHRKISGLNRARAADKILRAPFSGISPARDLREVCDDHGLDKSTRLEEPCRNFSPSAGEQPFETTNIAHNFKENTMRMGHYFFGTLVLMQSQF